MPTPHPPASEADAPAIPDIAWYHTLELPGGVVTPGLVDCRPIADRIMVPERLDGLRVLDIGTWDGFWAFELERRGAQVTTVDLPDVDELDWPPSTRLPSADAARRERMAVIELGVGFAAAKAALGSSVERVPISVYDLSPETVGTFDLVFVGSILVHLRDPVRALAAIRSVAEGDVILNESIELISSILSPRTPRTRFAGGGDLVLWWHSNLAGVRQMARSAGLVPQEESGRFYIPAGPGAPKPSRGQRLKALTHTQGREMLLTWKLGIAHVSIRCTVER
jgi:tRNA (mo5U34)-methyltransferase